MRLRLVALVLATMVPFVPSPADAARDDTFCVRVSKVVRGSDLNKRIIAGKATIRPVRASDCIPEPTPPGAFFDTVLKGASAITARVADVNAAFETSDVEAMTLALTDVVERSSWQDDWLGRHQPMECYVELHSDWVSLTSALYDGATDLLRGTLEAEDRIMLEMRRPGLEIPARLFASSASELFDQAGTVFRDCF